MDDARADDARWSDDPETPDDLLDADFPLGDGVAEVGGVIWCPYCGEANEVALDPGGGSDQEYVEDCQVCCQPWVVHVRWDGAGNAHLTAQPADGSGDAW